MTFRQLLNSWMELAGAIGDFQSRLLLTLFYFIFCWPFGLIARIAVDPLGSRRKLSDSAWTKRSLAEVGLEAATHPY